FWFNTLPWTANAGVNCVEKPVLTGTLKPSLTTAYRTYGSGYGRSMGTSICACQFTPSPLFCVGVAVPTRTARCWGSCTKTRYSDTWAWPPPRNPSSMWPCRVTGNVSVGVGGTAGTYGWLAYLGPKTGLGMW